MVLTSNSDLDTGWMTGVRLPAGALNFFHFITASRPALGSTQPPIQWVPAAFSVGIWRQRPEVDHSFVCSAEVKNKWIYTSSCCDTWLSTGTTLPFTFDTALLFERNL